VESGPRFVGGSLTVSGEKGRWRVQMGGEKKGPLLTFLSSGDSSERWACAREDGGR